MWRVTEPEPEYLRSRTRRPSRKRRGTPHPLQIAVIRWWNV
jgi:hypothetical protein